MSLATEFSDPQTSALVPCFSPCGCRIACGFSSTDRLAVLDTQTLQAQLTLTAEAPLASVRWSPDGLYLLGTPRAAQTAAAAARLPPVLVWDAEDGSLFAQLVGNAVAFTRWLPDGRHVLLCADVPLRASMWSLLTGDVVSLPPPKFPTRGVAASASGSVLAMLTRVECKDIVCLLTAGDWQVTARWPTATSDADDCAFCGDSALLLWEGAGGMCVLHDLDGVPLGQFAADAGLGVRLCSLSPDASILAVATVGAPGVVLLNTARFDTICELLHTGTVRGPPSVVVYREVPSEEAASAASVHYALADCPMQLLKAVDKSSAKMGVGLVAWSSDGQLLATRCDTYPTAVFVWDLPRLQLAALLLHLAPVRDMAWDPATSRLALCTGGPCLYLWTPHEASVVTAPTAGFNVTGLSWNASGGALALTSVDGNGPSGRAWCCAYVGRTA